MTLNRKIGETYPFRRPTTVNPARIEPEARDRTGRMLYPEKDGISDIARRLDELLRTMADLPSPAAASGRSDLSVLDAARSSWREERRRERIFGLSLLANPGWDILLDLFIAREEGREVSVGTLSRDIAAPEINLVRCVAHLLEEGLVVRRPDFSASEGPLLTLSDEGFRLIRAHFSRAKADWGVAGA